MSDFIINNGVLTKYTGAGGDVIIPEEVTCIGDKAFSFCTGLTSITIPGSIEKIGYCAFHRCSALTSVVISLGVMEIGNAAFECCTGLSNVIVPQSIKKIGNQAFCFCSKLSNVIIQNGVTEIGKEAFEYCAGLSSIEIPESVEKIGSKAFDGCASLTSITIPDRVTTIENGTFQGCAGLTSLVISPSVTMIGDRAFFGCTRLTNVSIPEHVTKIGDSAFFQCSSLVDVSISEHLTDIALNAFEKTPWIKSRGDFRVVGTCLYSYVGESEEVTIPAGVTEIGQRAFSGCDGLHTVVIPNTVTEIGPFAFNGCKELNKLILSQNLKVIGDGAFSRCQKLVSITLPDSVEEIGNNVFDWDLELTLPIKKIKLSKDTLAKVNLTTSSYVSLFLFQNGKWVDELLRRANLIPKQFAPVVLEALKTSGKDKECVRWTEYMLKNRENIPDELLLQAKSIFEQKKAKKALAILASEIDPIPDVKGDGECEQITALRHVFNEFLLDTTWTKYKCAKLLNLANIKLADGTTTAPVFLIKCAIVPYLEQYTSPENIGAYEKAVIEVRIVPDADNASQLLDRESLRFELRRIATAEPCFMLPLGRYMQAQDVDDIQERMFNSWNNWNDFGANGRKLIIAARSSILLNDSREAMIHLEKCGMLSQYARLRNTSADILRDTKLCEFGLDSNGKKQYSLGSKVITVTLNQTFGLELYDETAKKTIKSIPKKGIDPPKAEIAIADLSDMNKNIKKVLKARYDFLFSKFLLGNHQSSRSWQDAYMLNCLLKRVAQLVVWQQDDVTFILDSRYTPVLSDGTPYTITKGDIKVAHPLEMDIQDIERWQQYFSKNALKQPFEQIWEPKYDLTSIDPNRYQNCQISVFRFMNMEKHGIFFHDNGYHSELWIRLIACELDTHRTTFHRHEIAKDETFTLGKFEVKNQTRVANHIVHLLDKWTVQERIAKDDVSIVEIAKGMTLAQVIEFTNFSIESNAPNCTAALLNLKNERFPRYADEIQDLLQK